jgi:deoxycytidylate deaminase
VIVGVEHWLSLAAVEARKALCLRASCGAIIVKDDRILGAGYNAPPRDDVSLRICTTTRPSMKKPKADRTCCVHAEWRALHEALRIHPNDVSGATMVFTRVDGKGQISLSSKPYCTVCSRLALDAGIDFWILQHADGARSYGATAYHQLSERYDLL